MVGIEEVRQKLELSEEYLTINYLSNALQSLTPPGFESAHVKDGSLEDPVAAYTHVFLSHTGRDIN